MVQKRQLMMLTMTRSWFWMRLKLHLPPDTCLVLCTLDNVTDESTRHPPVIPAQQPLLVLITVSWWLRYYCYLYLVHTVKIQLFRDDHGIDWFYHYDRRSCPILLELSCIILSYEIQYQFRNTIQYQLINVQMTHAVFRERSFAKVRESEMPRNAHPHYKHPRIMSTIGV